MRETLPVTTAATEGRSGACEGALLATARVFDEAVFVVLPDKRHRVQALREIR